jgi:hypothetical protein
LAKLLQLPIPFRQTFLGISQALLLLFQLPPQAGELAADVGLCHLN